MILSEDNTTASPAGQVEIDPPTGVGAEPRVIEMDGYLVDEETGEVVGVVTPPEFVIDSQSAAEWVMNKMLEAESQVAAFDKTDAVIHAKAVLANAEAMKKPLQRRVEWLHKRFDNELGEFAKTRLTKTCKTWRCLFGTVSLRKVPARLALKDEGLAIRMAEDFKLYAAGLRVTKEFLISQITPADHAELVTGLIGHEWSAEDQTRKAFEIVPATEKVDVKTGAER